MCAHIRNETQRSSREEKTPANTQPTNRWDAEFMYSSQLLAPKYNDFTNANKKTEIKLFIHCIW